MSAPQDKSARLRPLLVFVMIAALASANEVPPDGEHERRTSAAVYLDDSFEVADAIEQSRRLQNRDLWSQAAGILHEASARHGDKLMQAGERRYVSSRDRINEIIAGWPAEGINEYCKIFERDAEEAAASALAGRDLSALLEVHSLFFCTRTGGAVANQIGQLAIEAGEFDLAARVYRRVLQEHPDAADLQGELQPMLVLASSLSGGTRADAAGLPPANPNANLRWKGEERPLTEVLTEIETYFRPLGDLQKDRQWPTFAGHESRSRIPAETIDELGLLWSFTLPSSSTGAPHPLVEYAETRGSRHLSRRYSALPVLSDELLYIQFFREIYALQRQSGVTAWRFRAEEVLVPASEFDDIPAGLDALHLSGRRLYATLSGEAALSYGFESARVPPALVCLDADSGRLIWNVDRLSLGSELNEVAFDPAPVEQRGQVFVVGRRRRSFGFEDCYLYRFRASDGALLSRTHLGSASTGSFGARRPTTSITAVHGDTIYVATNIGSVAAISTRTGRVRWLVLYDRSDEVISRESAWGVKDAEPWEFNPVIWSRGRLVVQPLDSPSLLVYSAEDGALLEAIPTETLGDSQSLLGVQGDLVCTVGGQAACYDLGARSTAWKTPLPEGESIAGRGQWVGDELLVPTRTRLLRFDTKTGEQRSTSWDRGGGNLLVVGNELYVAGVGGVSSYVRKADLLQTLNQRLAALPDDPEPALDLAEVILRGGEPLLAMSHLAEAVRRAELLEETLPDVARQRLFDDVLLFGQALSSPNAASEAFESVYEYAGRFAATPADHLQYRLVFAPLFEARGNPDRALLSYQQILRDRSLREAPAPVDSGGGTARSTTGGLDGGTVAEERVAALLQRHGRSIYATYEAEAARLLEIGRRTADDDILTRLTTEYPNADLAPQAWLARADVADARGEHDRAAELLVSVFRRQPQGIDQADLIRRIAESFQATGDLLASYQWLSKGIRDFSDRTFSDRGRLVTFRDLRSELERKADQLLATRPRLGLPLGEAYTHAFPADVRLLVPLSGETPGMDWSRYFVAEDEEVRAFSSVDHKECWSGPLASRTGVELIHASKNLLLFLERYRVVGVRPADGQVLWEHGGTPPDGENPVADWEDFNAIRHFYLDKSRLVTIHQNGLVRLIRLPSGELAWERTHRPAPERAVTIAGPWLVYAVEQDGRNVLRRLALSDGSPGEVTPTEEARPAEQLWSTFDGRVLLITSQTVTAFDPATGDRYWQFSTSGHVRGRSMLLDVDSLYLSDDGRTIKKVQVADGEVLWESEPVTPRSVSELVVNRTADGIIATSSHAVAAVDEFSGLLLWEGVAPDEPSFEFRTLTEAYVAAVHLPDPEDQEASDATAFFYDHRNASGVLASEGGLLHLGPVENLRQVLVVDGALLIQTRRVVRAWSSLSPRPVSSGPQEAGKKGK